MQPAPTPQTWTNKSNFTEDEAASSTKRSQQDGLPRLHIIRKVLELAREVRHSESHTNSLAGLDRTSLLEENARRTQAKPDRNPAGHRSDLSQNGYGGVVWVVQRINDTASLSWHVRAMHLIGWQNTWEQAPGVPATPSPPRWRGNPLAVYLCTRP